MTIIDFISRNKPWLIKKTINDDTFGKMWYNKEKDPEFNHYQGHFIFKPTNTEIDIYLDSDKSGIDPSQKSFYREIENKYFDIIETSFSAIEELLKKKKRKAISIQDFREEFILYAISLSRIPNKKWSLSFTSIKQPLIGITVQYSDWNVIDIL